MNFQLLLNIGFLFFSYQQKQWIICQINAFFVKLTLYDSQNTIFSISSEKTWRHVSNDDAVGWGICKHENLNSKNDS